jgi:hypothetical protein
MPPPDGTTGHPSPATIKGSARATAFVWSVWAILAVTLPVFPFLFSSPVPYIDDWTLVPILTGDEPADLAWLWGRHNEHRIPLPKLILVGLAQLAGCDVRAGMYFNCLLLSGLAAAMILAARRLRGRTAVTDAFFPLALMHWGHSEVLYYGIAVNVSLSTALVGLILIGLVHHSGRTAMTTGLVVGVPLVLLPFAGAIGLAVVPPLALWLAYTGVARWRAAGPHARREGTILIATAALACAACGLYFIGGPVTVYPTSRTAATTLLTALQVVSLAAGPAGEAAWLVKVIVLAGLCGVAAWGLVAVAAARPADRPRALGLLAFLTSLAALALAIGWGRPVGSFDVQLASTRYVTMAVPLLCWAYFTSCVCRSRLVPALLFLAMLLLLPVNTYEGWCGWCGGRKHRELLAAVEKDIQAGLSPAELSAKWTHRLYTPLDPIEGRLEMMQRKGVGPYRTVRTPPAEAPYPAGAPK